MEEAIVKNLASAGPFAVLFFWALWDKSQLTKQVMADSKNREDRLVAEKNISEEKAEEREEKLMECLGSLSSQYEGLSKDVDEVKEDVGEMKQDIKILKDRRNA